ncbi:MAG: hypothetical protein HY518_05735 [Candidatus Aenigmarchaeota archaeon]|nr:hypothetical protein [Candidatus Aenigmarchaeota archaeon]
MFSTFLHTFLIGVFSSLVIYGIYRNAGPALWAYLAAWLPDLPKFGLFFGATNIDTILLVTHTFGVVILPAILIVIDIFMIELRMAKYLAPLAAFSKTLREILMIERVIGRLQRYHAIPRPIRVARLYMISVIVGVMHLAINVIMGVF